jgi:hypothetical protein
MFWPEKTDEEIDKIMDKHKPYENFKDVVDSV